MSQINVLIDEEKINKRIIEIAKQIENKYKGEEIILVCVLKGAAYFAVELSKRIESNKVFLDFVKIKSYEGNSTNSSGNIRFDLDISQNIEDKNVIIVEDIIDTGLSLNYLYNYFKKKNPKNLEICVLLDKKERREINVDVDYTGFEIENKFVLGYGLDYDEKYRNLPYVGYIEN